MRENALLRAGSRSRLEARGARAAALGLELIAAMRVGGGIGLAAWLIARCAAAPSRQAPGRVVGCGRAAAAVAGVAFARAGCGGGRRRARRRASPRSRPRRGRWLPGCRRDVRDRRPPGDVGDGGDRRRRRAVRGAVQARSRWWRADPSDLRQPMTAEIYVEAKDVIPDRPAVRARARGVSAKEKFPRVVFRPGTVLGGGARQ